MLTYKQQEETTYRSERKEVSMAKTIRHSRQREKIYNYLMDAIEHPTAEMIHTALREEIFRARFHGKRALLLYFEKEP